jgi:hypothetical protein
VGPDHRDRIDAEHGDGTRTVSIEVIFLGGWMAPEISN